MKYIPGDCIDKKTHYYELSDDFIIIVCREDIRYTYLKTSEDYDVLTEDIDLSKGDIIHIKYFGHRNEFTYTYLSGYTHNDIYVTVNRETIISKPFIKINSLFIDITKQIERDNKIDKIIRNHE